MIWTILGISVGVVAVFCVAVSELFVGTAFFEGHRPHIAIALPILGGIAWFFARHFAGKRRKGDDGGSGKTFVLFDLRYWEPILIVFGVIIIFIQRLRPREEVLVLVVPAEPITDNPRQPAKPFIREFREIVLRPIAP